MHWHIGMGNTKYCKGAQRTAQNRKGLLERLQRTVVDHNGAPGRLHTGPQGLLICRHSSTELTHQRLMLSAS